MNHVFADQRESAEKSRTGRLEPLRPARFDDFWRERVNVVNLFHSARARNLGEAQLKGPEHVHDVHDVHSSGTAKTLRRELTVRGNPETNLRLADLAAD